jgi:hypothetical protein
LASTYSVAAKLLNEVLAQYGKTACDTPQMFETLLRKHGRSCPQEVDVLATALRHGIVTDLQSSPPTTDALARVLSVSAGMAPQQAEWAVETWAAALAAAPQTVAGPPRADGAERNSDSRPLRTVLVLAGAAITGSLAYLIWAP